MQKTKRRALSGVLLLDKPLEISSSKAVIISRAIYQAQKAGHTGSLDVLASGLLPICFGEATKFSQVLLDADKRYYTVAQLGERTETCDSEGEVIETGDASTIDLAAILACLQQFMGPQKQIPSMYSALKHNGQPLYKLARQGIEVERKPRDITIHQLDCLAYDEETKTLTLDVSCSKGTYIRNLVDDIGAALGCFAHVKVLRRLATGPFQLADAITIDELQEKKDAGESIDDLLLPVDCLLSHVPQLDLEPETAQRLQQGMKLIGLPWLGEAGSFCRVYCGQQFLGLAEWTELGELKAKRLLATNA